MFFNRGVFISDMFSYSVVDEACRATNIMLIAGVTRNPSSSMFFYKLLL